MNPGTLNLYIRSGDTFRQVWTISTPSLSDPTSCTPIDLTGCSAELQIISLYNVAPVYSLTTETPTDNGGTLLLGGTAGTVSINIPPEDSLLLANGQYDLKIQFADLSIMTFLAGNVFIESEVTVWV